MRTQPSVADYTPLFEKLCAIASRRNGFCPPIDKEPLPEFHSNAAKRGIDQVRAALVAGKVKPAIVWCHLLLSIGHGRALNLMRREALFRCSRYGYEAQKLEFLLATLLANDYTLAESESQYLISVRNLLSIASDVCKSYFVLCRQLKSTPRVFKSLMAAADLTFIRPPLGDRNLNSEEIDFYSGHDVANAFSLLTTVIESTIGLKTNDLTRTDPVAIHDGTCDALIISGAKLVAFHKAETMLDGLPYGAQACGRQVLVSSIDEIFERSLNLGYMQTDFQQTVQFIHSDKHVPKDAMSLFQFADDFYRRTHKKTVKLLEIPMRRYVVLFHEGTELFKMFANDSLFAEDIEYLNALSYELHAEQKDAVLSAAVAPNLTVLDLIKFRRFFIFTTRTLRQAIDAHPVAAEHPELEANSMLPVFKLSVFEQLVGQVFSKEKADALTELFFYLPASGAYFDVQYQPFIAIDDFAIVAPNILCASNIVRNLLAANGRRLLLATDYDPMVETLATHLSERGFLVAKGASKKVDGKTLEVDILAYLDGVLFIFECKNAYHPCSPHEVRATYDLIMKGGEQLTRAKTWLANSTVQTQLFKQLGWTAMPTEAIETCLATATRIFNGYEVQGHPVRHAFELANVLTRGAIKMNEVRYRIWKDFDFSVVDLVAHIRGDTTLADAFASMGPVLERYQFGASELAFERFGLDPNRLFEITEARYQLFDVNADRKSQG